MNAPMKASASLALIASIAWRMTASCSFRESFGGIGDRSLVASDGDRRRRLGFRR
jgi:hypothetical protein